MKTQIIHLESHDDTHSVTDKMDWSQTPRVLLIWPEKNDVLIDHLDLVILERHSTSLGSQLGLVADQPDVIYNAKRAGIPHFKSRAEAQTRPWPRSQRYYRQRSFQEKILEPKETDLSEKPEKDVLFELPPWARLTTFTVAVIAVLTIAFLLLPRSEIIIPVQDQWTEVIIPVRASPDIQNVYVSGALPAREISVSIEKRAQMETTGTVSIPETYAAGEVIFTNLTDHKVNVPKNTTLTTGGEDPVSYRTLHAVELPAGTGTKVEAQIKAKDPGSSANREAGAVSGIGADFGADLTVTNPQPIRGGKDIYLSIPSERDKQRLTEQVIQDVKEDAQERLKQKMEPGDMLISETPIIKEIEEKEFAPSEGEPGETLEVNIRVKVSGWIVRDQDLRTLAQDVMQTNQYTNQYQPVSDTLTYQPDTKITVHDNREAEWMLAIKWQRKPSIKESEIVSTVLGQTPSRAKRQLTEKYNLTNPPQISIFPSWWPRLPFLPFRIKVE